MTAPNKPSPNLADHIDATEQQRSILDILTNAYPRNVAGESIIDLLYRDDPKGGAEYARVVVSVQMNRLRKLMAGSGWTIPRSRGGRGQRGRYGLVREAGHA